MATSLWTACIECPKCLKSSRTPGAASPWKPPDVSDVEQQEALLAQTSTSRWFSRPRMAAVVSAVVLHSAATFVVRGAVTPNGAAIAVTGGENPGARKLNLESIQAFATANVGRMLTRAEAERVQHSMWRFVAKGSRGAKLARGQIKGLKVRSLEEDEDEDEIEDLDDIEGISKECKDGMKKMQEEMMEKALPKIFAAALDAAMACAEDEESDDCKKAEKAMDAIEADMTKECKKEGNVCSMLTVMPDAGKNETEETCVPKECHKHADVAADVEATEELKEEKGCTKCYAKVTCGKK